MIETRIIKDASGAADLCETYSTENKKLLQEETGVTYGSAVVDVVEGYHADGAPFSRFTYTETGEMEMDTDKEDAL